eukprot:TRINITY_DN6051_c0_g1_i15.p2 TRINITY_DN6051_c0_g1~~TRINITY_DN6051_c0_g1_i15.p2  ORF type:complete len:224 (-),score=11.03 TRINITY_DN6051_c0_g1_i15:1168-1839(-)
MMCGAKSQQQQQQPQQLQQQFGGSKDGMFIRWTMCMTSSFIGIFCICILWLRYWLPAYEYRTCLADGLHEGFIDAATYAEYWLPKTVTPCAASGEFWNEQYIQQMGMLPVVNYATVIDVNRKFLQPLHAKQAINMLQSAPLGSRYAEWCQSISLNQCDPYYLHLIYTVLICFTCTICCLYSILTQYLQGQSNHCLFFQIQTYLSKSQKTQKYFSKNVSDQGGG